MAGTPSTAAGAVVAARALRADVVIMGRNLPDGNRITAHPPGYELRSRHSVLILTMLEDTETVTAALRSGDAVTW